MRRIVAVMLAALVAASGCSATEQPDAPHPGRATVSHLSADSLVGALRYRSSAGDTILENVVDDDGVAALGVMLLGHAMGVAEPARVLRAIGTRALRTVAGRLSWRDAFVLATSAARWPGPMGRPRVARLVASLPAPVTGQDQLWAALTRQQGFRTATARSTACAEATTAARAGSATAWTSAVDTYAAARSVADCRPLTDVVRARVMSLPPTTANLARACLVASCAGQLSSVRRFVSERILELGRSDLQGWGDVTGADYAVLGSLGERTHVRADPEGSGVRTRVDALARAGGLPASVADPSDLGLLLSTVLARETRLTLTKLPATAPDRSVTARYAADLRADATTSTLRAIARTARWTSQDWFVAGLENLRSGACPAGLGKVDREALSNYVRFPRSSTMQMAALAGRMLARCHVRSEPDLAAAAVRTALQVQTYENGRGRAASLQLAWSARNTLCFTGARPDDASAVAAARSYLAALTSTGVSSWDLGEFFAARRLAAGTGCGHTWFR